MSEARARDCEVAIIGGGMVGASLALALAGSGRHVVLIEAVAPEVAPPAEAAPESARLQGAAHRSFDDRTTALSNGSRRIFETLGVWPAIAARAAPIRQIHISDAGHFGFARLDAAAHTLDAFGYTVGNRHLGTLLWRSLAARGGVELWSPARLEGVRLEAEAATLSVREQAEERVLRARLVVAADGEDSLVKRAAAIGSSRSDYGQVALVANVRTDFRAGATAYERFTSTGPLALLPRYDGGYAAIWTVAAAIAQPLQECSDGEFCSELQQRFGWRAGRIVRIGRRASYPLSLVRAHSSIGQRTALVGNAAQTLHPIAAQGFNLGLRDAAVLAEVISGAGDAGANATLAQFARRRSSDRSGMIAFTDGLVKLFGDRRALARVGRDLALLLFDLSTPAKQALSRLSWGFGTLPRLERGLPLAVAAAAVATAPPMLGGAER